LSARRPTIGVDRIVALVALSVAVGLLIKIMGLDAMARPVRLSAICASGVALGAAIAMLWRRTAWLSSLAFLMAGGLAFELVVAHEDRVYSELMIGAAVVAGWAFGALMARFAATNGRSRGVQESAGHQGVIGAMAAVWALAAISKILDGGGAWVGPGTVWHVVLAHVDVSVAADQRSALASVLLQPQVATGLAALVLATEASAPLLLWRGRPRQVVTIALALVHVGLSFVGMLHVPIALMILGIGLAPPAPRLRWRSRRALIQTGAVSALLVTLVWLLPIDRWMAVSSNRRSKGWHIKSAPRAMPDKPHAQRR